MAALGLQPVSAHWGLGLQPAQAPPAVEPAAAPAAANILATAGVSTDTWSYDSALKSGAERLQRTLEEGTHDPEIDLPWWTQEGRDSMAGAVPCIHEGCDVPVFGYDEWPEGVCDL